MRMQMSKEDKEFFIKTGDNEFIYNKYNKKIAVYKRRYYFGEK